MSDPNHITRAQLAALIGAKSASYINELEAQGRAIRAPGGKLWLRAESLAAWHASRDPSKQGVADRHAAARAAAQAATPHPEPDGDGPDDDAEPPEHTRTATAGRSAGAADIGGSYQQARAVKEKFFALEAKRAYEQAMGQLREGREVEHIAATAMTELRQRLENLATTLAPELAAIADEARIRAALQDQFAAALESASHHFARLSAKA